MTIHVLRMSTLCYTKTSVNNQLKRDPVQETFRDGDTTQKLKHVKNSTMVDVKVCLFSLVSGLYQERKIYISFSFLKILLGDLRTFEVNASAVQPK